MIPTAETNKRYYWLKLKDDFFRQKEIKQLRKIAGGDSYTIIYLKMLLRSLKDDGKLYYEGVDDDFISELALDIDEDVENVKMTVAFLMAKGLLVQSQTDEYTLSAAESLTGSEGFSAERMRRLRRENNNALPIPQSKPKSNAERQRAFRAKQNCEKRHMPMVDDHTNTKRYNGNYYLVLQRDRYQCAICESTENLCVHHIDGYNENKPENSATNRMIVLCRSCHMRVHRSGLEIPQDLLDAIGYETDSNVTSDAPVTASDEEKREKREEKEKEKESREKKRKRFTPPTVEEIKAYAYEIDYNLDAQYFYDYYQTNNWRKSDGKPILNWKLTVQTWKRNDQQRGIDTHARRTDPDNEVVITPEQERIIADIYASGGGWG